LDSQVAGVAEWVGGARPRTLPAALAPVLAGSGAAALVDAFSAVPAALALVVALGLQVGVNYANDYSDGIRGADDVRVGPTRLVGSGAATPSAVRTAAGAAAGVAVVAGTTLAAMTSWWLLVLGAAAIAAAWGYTGTSHPYGYAGLGEVSCFCFFGLLAVCGTTYVQAGRVTGVSVLAAVGVGALACALLVINNLRDAPTDEQVGKRTLAVRLGDPRTRAFYAALNLVALGVLLALVAVTPWVLLGLVALPLQLRATRAVLTGRRGHALTSVLRDTGLAELAWAVGLTLGLLLA